MFRRDSARLETLFLARSAPNLTEGLDAEHRTARKIDAVIAEKNLLKHPFLSGLQAGKLTRESLQLYARQYYKHVEAFPAALACVAARADESLKPVVMENLAEKRIRAPHPKLWRNFAAALGVSEEEVTSERFPARDEITW